MRHDIPPCHIIPYLHLHPGHGRARFCLHWASFTLAKLVNLAKTVSARISARVKCKQTPSPSELFCSYVLYVIKGKIWQRPGQAKCKWDSSPAIHDLPSQCKSEGSPGHGQTGEGNFGEGLVRLSVKRVLYRHRADLSCFKLILNTKLDALTTQQRNNPDLPPTKWTFLTTMPLKHFITLQKIVYED